MNAREQAEQTEELYARAMAAARYIGSVTHHQPKLAIILGSGLGGFAQELQDAVTIPYAKIPNFPLSTVEGHAGEFVLGTIDQIPVAILKGRVHLYEGYSLAEVTFPIRVLGLLGIERVLLTNAAGGINTGYGQGAIVAIADHINFTGTNAALGPNDPRVGPRFFDMTQAYSPRLRQMARDEAQKQGWELKEGVYIATLGPSYETPAEIRAFRTLGADLVGMSTVHEVIVARHMGLEILGFSVVTNMAAGVLDKPINHNEVMETGRRIAGQFTGLIKALIPQIAALEAAEEKKILKEESL
jgi:purine-nucleoside phosphorylase